MAIQASPDLLSLAVDHLQNGSDDTVPTELVNGIKVFLGANLSAVAPLFPGRKALQTSLKIDESPVKTEDAPIKTIKDEAATAIEDAKRFSSYEEPKNTK